MAFLALLLCRVYEYQKIPPLISHIPVKTKRSHLGAGGKSTLAPHTGLKSSNNSMAGRTKCECFGEKDSRVGFCHQGPPSNWPLSTVSLFCTSALCSVLSHHIRVAVGLRRRSLWHGLGWTRLGDVECSQTFQSLMEHNYEHRVRLFWEKGGKSLQEWRRDQIRMRVTAWSILR